MRKIGGYEIADPPVGALDGQVGVVGESAATEHFLAPVHEGQDALSGSEALKVGLGETRLQAVEREGFVDCIRIAGCIRHRGQPEGRLHAEGVVGGNDLPDTLSAPGRNKDDAVSAAQAIQGRGSCIAQDRDVLHLDGGEQARVALDAVHEDKGIVAVERTPAADDERGGAGPGHAGALPHQQAGHLPVKSVQDVPAVRERESLPSHRVGGEGRVLLGLFQPVAELERIVLGPEEGRGRQEGGEGEDPLFHLPTIRGFAPVRILCSPRLREGHSDTIWD